jgi:hypothetical protein
MFKVESDLDDEHPIGSLRQGGTMFATPSPSFTREGLLHLANPPPHIIRSNQTNPNDIQLDDILKDENMEV